MSEQGAKLIQDERNVPIAIGHFSQRVVLVMNGLTITLTGEQACLVAESLIHNAKELGYDYKKVLRESADNSSIITQVSNKPGDVIQ